LRPVERLISMQAMIAMYVWISIPLGSWLSRSRQPSTCLKNLKKISVCQS
jgi:hypothetical protein